MSGKIFEYAVIYHPKASRKKDEDGESVTNKSVLVVDVKRVIAEGESEVLILASREIPDEYLNKLDQVEIAVRPF